MEEHQDVKNFLVGKLKRALFVALFILTLTSCAGMGGLTQGGDKTKGTEKAERLSALLHEKVNKLRSFEAEYWVEGKSKSAFILLAVNRKRNYAVFKPIGGPNVQELPATIFDGGSNSPRLLIVPKPGCDPSDKSGDCVAIGMTFEDMMQGIGRGDPFLMIMNGLKKIGAKLDQDYFSIKAESIGPNIKLAQEEENASMHMGLDVEGYKFSWAEKQSLAKAERIEETKGKVVVHYSRDHTVVIDKKTGLLLEDVWKGKGDTRTRSITLRRFAAIDGDAPLGAYLPQLASMPVEKAPESIRSFGTSLALFMSLARAIEEEGDFEKLFTENKDEFHASTYALSREYWSGMMDQAAAERVMRSYYAELAENPKDAGASFEIYLELMESAQIDIVDGIAERLLKELSPFPVRDVNIANLPDQHMKLFNKVYDTGIHACEKGFTDAAKDALRKYLQEKSGKKGKPLS